MKEGKPQRSEEGSTGADQPPFPSMVSQVRRSRVLGRLPLSRSRLRELRALSMPDLDKLCGEGFSGPPQPACFKTELEITPRRSLVLPSQGSPTKAGGTGSGSPRDSSSGTPGSASDDDAPHGGSPDVEHLGNSWSLRSVFAISMSHLFCSISFHSCKPLLTKAHFSFDPDTNSFTLSCSVAVQSCCSAVWLQPHFSMGCNALSWQG